MLPPRRREVSRYFIYHEYVFYESASKYNLKPVFIFVTDGFWGAMLTGTMEVLEDSFYKEMIWQEGDTMLPGNKMSGPDYCVLRFTAEQEILQQFQF